MAETVTTAFDNFTNATEPPGVESKSVLLTLEQYVWRISVPVLLLFGTTGNGLVILVLTVRRLKPYPSSFLLVCLAIFDTSWLWTGPWRNFWLYGIPGTSDFRNDSDLSCKLHTFMTYCSVSLSVWTLVLVTSQRVVAVSVPLKAKTLLTMRRTVYSMIVVSVACVTFNLHIFWTVGIVEKTNRCFFVEEQKDLLEELWPNLDLAVNSILPFLVLLICNSVIIYKVRTGSKLLSKDVKDYKSSTSKANTAMTIMLISVNVLFLVTTTPYCIYNADALENIILPHSDADYLAYAIFYVIQCINSAANFYIYCLSGQKFREELILTFTKKKKRRNSAFERSVISSKNGVETGTTNISTTNANGAHRKVNGHVQQPTQTVKDAEVKVEQLGVVNEACEEQDQSTRL